MLFSVTACLGYSLLVNKTQQRRGRVRRLVRNTNKGKEAIRSRELKIESVNGDVQTFKNGTYNNATGAVSYTTKTLPKMVEKLTHLHKASTKDPLFYLNIFFGFKCLFVEWCFAMTVKENVTFSFAIISAIVVFI